MERTPGCRKFPRDKMADHHSHSNNSEMHDLIEEQNNTVEAASFENVLEAMGGFGKYQLWQVFIAFLGCHITAPMAFSFVFLGYEPPHACNTVNESKLLNTIGQPLLNLNHTTAAAAAAISYASCDIKISTNESYRNNSDVIVLSCPNGRNFSKAKDISFLSEWDLVCEDSGRAELSHLIFTVGQFAGGLMISTLADLFGRKPVIVTASFFAFATELGVVFSPSIYFVDVLRFFCGLFYQGLSCCFLVFGMEWLLPKHRQVYGVIICIIWVVEILFVGFLAYLFRDSSWRYFQASVAANGGLFFLCPIFLSESPRWLAVKGRFKESLEILRKSCKINGIDFEHVRVAFDGYAERQNKDNLKQTNNSQHKKQAGRAKYSFLTLFSHRQFIIMTLSAWYIWITHNLTYYGLYMTSSTLLGNRFINFSLMALVEIPSDLIILYAMAKLSRRTVLRIFLALAAVFLTTSALLVSLGESSGGHGVASTVLFIAGKFAITASFNTLYIVTPEIFPTSLRVTGSGSCSSVDKVGSMVAPFLRPLANRAGYAPALIFSLMCVGALALTFVLPETKNFNLTNTLTDTYHHHHVSLQRIACDTRDSEAPPPTTTTKYPSKDVQDDTLL